MQYPGFCGSSKPSQSPIVSIERAVNWYVERRPGPAFYPTPGCADFATATDVGARAGWSLAGRCFTVMGPGLWEVLQTGLMTKRGTLAQDNYPATISYNGVTGGQLFITSGGNGYCYVLATNVLTQVLTGDATQGGMKDGYFLAFSKPTGRVRLSNLNDGTVWDPTQFFARSIAPDPWQAMIVGNPEIFFVGETTGEAWYNAGNFPQPFAPILSSFWQSGTRAPFSVTLAGGSPLWVAQTAEGGGTVVRLNGYTPQTISDYPVATALATAARTTTLDDAETFVYNQEGHTFAVVSLATANLTWVVDLDTGDWHERGTWNTALARYDVWAPRVHVEAFGQHLIGTRGTGVLSTLDVTLGHEAGGGPIRRLRIPPALQPSGTSRITVERFSLSMDVGLGLSTGQGSNPLVMMRSTGDGRTWGAERAVSGGAIGAFDTRVFWTRNGSGSVLWAPEISCSDPIPWRIAGADVMGTGFTQRQAAA